MTDQELIERFELTPCRERFFSPRRPRAPALRLSLALPCLAGARSILRGAERFAAARGKSQLYHETYHDAQTLFLIRERMARSQIADWDEFARANPDLFTWKNGILARDHREETLHRYLARTIFLFPDKGC